MSNIIDDSGGATPDAHTHLAHAQARHMRRALEGAIANGIATLDALDAPAEDLEDGHDAEHDLADAEHDLGWPAYVSQVNLGRNTDDGDITALERHGRGFIRSGPDDSEDGGDAERDEDSLFWSIDVGCAIGAPLDVEGAHV